MKIAKYTKDQMTPIERIEAIENGEYKVDINALSKKIADSLI